MSVCMGGLNFLQKLRYSQVIPDYLTTGKGLIITYDKPDQKVIYAKIDSLAFGARGPGLIQTNLNSNSKVPCWEFDLAKGYPDVGGWKQWKLKYSQPRKRARRKDSNSKSCPRGCSKIKLYLILLALATAIALASAYYTDACATSQNTKHLRRSRAEHKLQPGSTNYTRGVQLAGTLHKVKSPRHSQQRV